MPWATRPPISYTSGVSGVPNSLLYCAVDPVDYQASVTCPAYGAAHVTGTTTATFDSAGDKLTSTNADGDTTTYAYGYGSTAHPGLVSTTDRPRRHRRPPTPTTGPARSPTRSVYLRLATRPRSTPTTPTGASTARSIPSRPPRASPARASPPSPPPRPPANVTSTFYDADGRVIQTTNPSAAPRSPPTTAPESSTARSHPPTTPAASAAPRSEPTTPPTVGSDPYLGATITTYDAAAEVIQVTNPLGGITLSTYDAAGNLTSTTTSSPTTPRRPQRGHRLHLRRRRPGHLDDGRIGVFAARDHAQGLRPQRQRVLHGFAQRLCAGHLGLPVPALAGRLDHQPAQSHQPLLDYPDLGPGQQRHHDLLQRATATGPEHQPRRRTPPSPPSTPTGGPTARRIRPTWRPS